MAKEPVLWEKVDQVVTVTLNQSETLNALTPEMVLRFREVVDYLAGDANVRAVVLTGSGRGFCSGANLLGGSGQTPGTGGLAVRDSLVTMNQVLTGITEMEKPWLAAVNGPAVGGGCSLALACDLVLMAESAYLALGYVNVGAVLDMGSTFLLPRLVGLQKAKELAFFGERVVGSQAVEMGLANLTVPDGALMDTALEWAARLAAGPTRSIGATKLGMHRALHGTFRDALHWEAMMLALVAQSDDAAEGLLAFLQTRAPRFRGR